MEQWKSSISTFNLQPDQWSMTDYRLQYKNACKLPTVLELPKFERLVQLHDIGVCQYGKVDNHLTDDGSITSSKDDYFTGKTVQYYIISSEFLLSMLYIT